MLDKHEDCKQEDLFYSELKSADESRRYECAQNTRHEDEVLKLVLADPAQGDPKEFHRSAHSAEQAAPRPGFNA